ncbi:tautomerase family protein [Liquorilactobacillus mali]|uniref:4-oxalocrotonate tautomerase-like protein n=1 Tax=Liquorilactobacillus mali KCTC 3596 = DSM 20444 TaxID=1046596 RepID=J0L7I9_9LACO|nr:tautomerase family protein [Liquorilactobacillus mali]EJF01264.1 4-oxalocrotonate tautomerase-like protein [Liquorilactobacillus mali KCTC 3596 = DSM 20444]KRN08602.1 4-oxalocrotonate tautomerase-like protein [Liquorilactobacillus mali KCTC 3596 = DSM 20444]MDC7952791.1 tautomerase family protein [Liquorilactobacillus mali]QFQ75423.1 tautomerase family protein [Liquorilactobacillus mali]
MPLMRVDVIKGHDQKYLKKLLDIAYETQVETLATPENDRYQILTQHEKFEMQIRDTGLGIERTDNVVVFNLVTRPRSTKAKQVFYSKIVERLNNELGIRKEDIMFSLVPNNDDDWSFGNGEAQFLNGKL